jgi:GNAT superfamily N-acetyltransferase
MRLEVHPVTPDRAVDLVAFSEAHGKFRYCSCMRWRMTSSEYKRSTKESRIVELDRRARRGDPIGVLGYRDREPVGWCSIAPRESYGALERFRALGRIDEEAVWSVVCFFIDRRVRGQGATADLLMGAVDYAIAQGAKVIEGYPIEPGPRLYTYMGSPASFLLAGFQDVTPPGRSRAVMRYAVEGRGSTRITAC